MAKRFTDTGKWDKAWFRKLTPEMKCAWIFLCDRCDHAGVWEIDAEALAFFIGAEITIEKIIETFDGKLRQSGNKLVLGGFADFQYGSLNPSNRVHKSVIQRLESIAPKKGLKRPFKGHTDTDTDKDTDKDKDRLFNSFAKRYRDNFPGTTTGAKAKKRFYEQFGNSDQTQLLAAAIDHYRLSLNAQSWRAAKTTFETFLGSEKSGFFWKDYIDPPSPPVASPQPAGSMRGA